MPFKIETSHFLSSLLFQVKGFCHLSISSRRHLRNLSSQTQWLKILFTSSSSNKSRNWWKEIIIISSELPCSPLRQKRIRITHIPKWIQPIQPLRPPHQPSQLRQFPKWPRQSRNRSLNQSPIRPLSILHLTLFKTLKSRLKMKRSPKKGR